MIGSSATVCPSLPSSDAALAFVRGEPGGFTGVVSSYLLRTVLIMGGLYVVGERDHLIRNSFGAATAIELFVLGWVAKKNAEAR